MFIIRTRCFLSCNNYKIAIFLNKRMNKDDSHSNFFRFSLHEILEREEIRKDWRSWAARLRWKNNPLNIFYMLSIQDIFYKLSERLLFYKIYSYFRFSGFLVSWPKICSGSWFPSLGFLRVSNFFVSEFSVFLVSWLRIYPGSCFRISPGFLVSCFMISPDSWFKISSGSWFPSLGFLWVSNFLV